MLSRKTSGTTGIYYLWVAQIACTIGAENYQRQSRGTLGFRGTQFENH